MTISRPEPGNGPLGGIGNAAFTALSLLFILFIGVGDYFTGLEVDFTVFYTVPIALATWRLGLGGGFGIAVLCKVSQYSAKALGGQVYGDPWARFWNAALHLVFFLAIVVVFHLLKLAYRREQAFGREDLLTGLPNSRAFAETADRELRRARRTGDPVSLLYLDCDDFKAINDRYGHSAGDALLCFVGGILKVQVRETDTPARIGGDEFAVLLPGADAVATREVAERLRAALEAPATQGERGLKASMGAATFLTPPDSVDALLRAGDTLMYEAKAAGKANIRTAIYPDSRAETRNSKL